MLRSLGRSDVQAWVAIAGGTQATQGCLPSHAQWSVLRPANGYLRMDMKWENTIFSYEEFFKNNKTPSLLEYGLMIGLEDEISFRALSAHIIQVATRWLRMPQACSLTAQILMHQFYSVDSFLRHPVVDVAMAAVLVASKTEDCLRRIRDIVNTFNLLHQKLTRPTAPPKIMEYLGSQYDDWRGRIEQMEMVMLRKLGFHVQPSHPYGLLANYLNALELGDNPRLGQKAINYLNDAGRGLAYICFQPNTVACAAINLASCDLNLALPEHPAAEWHLVFDVGKEDLVLCEDLIKKVYNTQVDASLPMQKEEFKEFFEFRGYKETSAPTLPSSDIPPNDGVRARSPKRSRRGGPDRSRSRSRDYYKRSSHYYDRRSPSRSRDRTRSPSRDHPRFASRTYHRHHYYY